jgi:hypothetical protein
MNRRRPIHYVSLPQRRDEPRDHPVAPVNDDGYHWTYCVLCCYETEHEATRCQRCDTCNPIKHSDR